MLIGVVTRVTLGAAESRRRSSFDVHSQEMPTRIAASTEPYVAIHQVSGTVARDSSGGSQCILFGRVPNTARTSDSYPVALRAGRVIVSGIYMWCTFLGPTGPPLPREGMSSAMN